MRSLFSKVILTYTIYILDFDVEQTGRSDRWSKKKTVEMKKQTNKKMYGWPYRQTNQMDKQTRNCTPRLAGLLKYGFLSPAVCTS